MRVKTYLHCILSASDLKDTGFQKLEIQKNRIIGNKLQPDSFEVLLFE